MNANQMGRAAYIAAHKILTTNLDSPEKACPGMRRSIAVDRVAEIIMDVFGAHSMTLDEQTDWWAREELIEEVHVADRVAPSDPRAVEVHNRCQRGHEVHRAAGHAGELTRSI